MAPDDFESPFEDDELEDVGTGSQKGRFNLNRRYLLIGIVTLALICLVGILIFRILTDRGGDVAEQTPTPILEPTEGPTVIATIEEEPTATPTRVISAEPTEEATSEPTIEPTIEATAVAGIPVPPTPITPPIVITDEGVSFVAPERVTELLKNGDFEEGVDEWGVGLNWQSFTNGDAIVSFSSEVEGPFVKSGASAQRISIAEATQQDRYAGIYQTVEVAPGQPYTLELYGQIRTGLGDIQASSYGYRMQYALDYSGGQDWRNIPAEDWVELPWDEQPFDVTDPKFLSYTTTITPTSATLTLFVRAWNKWADPGLVEYTVDSLSLIGRTTAPVSVVSAENGLIPVTGEGDPLTLFRDGRFWGAVLILLLLSAGAIYRGRWGY